MSHFQPGRPEPKEYDPDFEFYISRVPEADIYQALEEQLAEFAALLSSVQPAQETYRYAEGKWSVREVVGHMIDSERVFGYRALSVSRGETVSLPGYDQEAYGKHSNDHEAPLKELQQEFEFLRKSHILFYKHLSKSGWTRMGVANDNQVTARAVAYSMVGHVRHHMQILKERYLSAPPVS